MKIFVVVSAAIPKTRNKNAVGVRVNAACKRASKAEEIAKNIRANNEVIVGDLSCEIHTSVVEIELDES